MRGDNRVGDGDAVVIKRPAWVRRWLGLPEVSELMMERPPNQSTEELAGLAKDVAEAKRIRAEVAKARAILRDLRLQVNVKARRLDETLQRIEEGTAGEGG